MADPSYFPVIDNAAGLFRVDRPVHSPPRPMMAAHWHDVLESNYAQHGVAEDGVVDERVRVAPVLDGADDGARRLRRGGALVGVRGRP